MPVSKKRACTIFAALRAILDEMMPKMGKKCVLLLWLGVPIIANIYQT